MKTFTDVDQFFNAVRRSIQKTAKNEATKHAKQVASKNAREIAAGSHSRGSGGIADEENVRVIVEGGTDGSATLHIDNIAKPQDTLWPHNEDNAWDSSKDRTGTAFAEMINDGAWVDAKAFIDSGYEKPAPKRAARPFWNKTAEELEATLTAVVEEGILNNI